MYRKIVWCYIFVLTLLDISLNTKLSAQGKSHGVTVHDSLIEGITFQEWGKESDAEGAGRGGRAVAAGALSLSPPALEFGRAALATAHALTVTLTNTANTTMHLASVAGTTPDFHASFFESKTLPPQANTSFSVVYLGRREGPVSAHLYIHTSLGVHKYPVSAVGVASEWGVWPLVGVRVPINATVEPLLTIHNPTDQTIQVSEVYSSGAWLGLALPGGGAAAPRDAWAVPPRAARPLVRLRLQPPPAVSHSLTAYIRIKANITGGGLVVCVEARSVPAGEHVSPLQLRLRTRGSRDPPDMVRILCIAHLHTNITGGGLVVCVEARNVPAGEHVSPLQLRLRTRGSRDPPVMVRILITVHCTHLHTNITGGGLVVCVEARNVPAGEHVSPLQLRLRPRGSRDPPDMFEVSAGNSAATGVPLAGAAGAVGARCAPDPPDLAPPHYGPPDTTTTNGNGVKTEGVHVTLLQPYLEPHQQLTRAAQFTLDYAALWAGYVGAGRAARGAWCAGWLRLGRAMLPYSLRLLPGTLRLAPRELHFVTANRDDSLRMREVRVRNEFSVPVHITHIDIGPDVDKYFEVESLAPLTVPRGGGALVLRVRLRRAAADAPGLSDAPDSSDSPDSFDALDASLSTQFTLRTNLTDYSLPLLMYSGRLNVEWEWPNSADGELRLGVVGTSSTRRVRVALHNPAPTALCVAELALELAGATLALTSCAHLSAPPPKHACRCIAAGARAAGVLTVVAPGAAGERRGRLLVWARAPHEDAPPALTRRAVSLAAHAGRLSALPLQLAGAAPYVWAEAPLVLESTMALRMRVLSVALPPDEPALQFRPPAEPAELSAGRHAVGTVLYAPERLCEPACYTGLDVHTAEGEAWVRRAAGAADELAADAALQGTRHAAFLSARAPRNVSLHVQTSHVLQVRARGAVPASWPRLAPARAGARLAAVGGAAPLVLRARNPSTSHALLLQPVLAAPGPDLAGSTTTCAGCTWARDAWALMRWRATRGVVREWHARDDSEAARDEHLAARDKHGAARDEHEAARDDHETAHDEHEPAHEGSHVLPLLLLAPDAELELTLNFTPHQAAHLAAYLFLRNNLTIMEGVLLTGRGAFPHFELGGRRPGSDVPLQFDVSECGGTVRRTVLARNTGEVAVLLRDWRVAGQPCQARGFRLAPCAPLALRPNESRALTLAFTPDYTLARVHAELSARADTARAAFVLAAAAPARLLPRCAAAAPRPPWEPAARAAAELLALAALALVLAAAALDAERELRRARAARPPPARQPLDLRALARHAPPAPPAPASRRAPARRRRTPRRDAPPLDPQAERRAFERWRAEVLGRNDDDDSRSSEDADRDQPEPAPADREPLLDNEAPEPLEDLPAVTDGYEADPETEDRPQCSGDEDAASTGSGSASASSSTPTVDERDENDDADEPETAPARSRTAPVGAAGPPAGAPPLAPDAAPRPARLRRDAGEPGRREARARTAEPGEVRARPGLSKHHARKDKPSKRPRERLASPPRASPAQPAAPGLRWGASWSSVVARGPLAPIGSDVRRREPERALGGTGGDHSLFYFNGDAAHAHPAREADFSWRPAPSVERPPAFAPSRDFLDEPSTVSGVGAVGSGAFRSLNSVWGSTLEPRPAAAAWLWGGYAEPTAPAGTAGSAGPVGPVRPPPGFGAPPRPVRPYDPFRSLASIWAPGALDWRSEGEPAPEPDA